MVPTKEQQIAELSARAQCFDYIRSKLLKTSITGEEAPQLSEAIRFVSFLINEASKAAEELAKAPAPVSEGSNAPA